VLQSVRENGNEAIVVYRLTRKVGISLVANKEDRLRGQRTAVCLDPAPDDADQRAGPQANPFAPKVSVEHFQDDAAHVLVGEEIVARELLVIHHAVHVYEEGIAAPAREEAVLAGLRHPLRPDPSRPVLIR
jgi:hypothetical protein